MLDQLRKRKLDRAYQDRSALLSWLKATPEYDPIRADPRFDRLLRRVGLTH
jgi:hypothetical protein